MKSYTTYILYSEKRKRYYVGRTTNEVEDRLRRHNTNHKGYTGKTGDWEIKYIKRYWTKRESIKAERKIKKRGAKRFLEDQKE